MSEQQWQSIETAPKDREFIGFVPFHATAAEKGSVWVMRWDDEKYAKSPLPHFKASGWVWGVRAMRSQQPTHWMPLPAPPTPEGSTR